MLKADNVAKKTKNLFGLICVIALLAAPIVAFLLQKPEPAPEAVFTSISGEQIALSGLRGQPVLVTFWATDCPSCVKEIPHLKELHRQYHYKGLHIIAVAMYYDPPNHVVEMARTMNIPYTVALDLRGEHAQAFGGVRYTPTTVLVSPAGQIEARFIGQFDLADMHARIQSLLNKG